MSVNFNFKYYRESRLITLIILLYIISEALIGLIVCFLESNGLGYARFYPATAILISAFALINTQLHKSPWLWKKLIKIPLIRGTYEGDIVYEYDGQERQKMCKLIITQTTSKIKIDSFFWQEDDSGKKISKTKTESESIVEDFISRDNGLYELLFYYRQKGNYSRDIPMREGFNTLIYKNNKTLEGTYFARNSKAKGNGG